tara:strand:- start:271 stop:636 length:366 start_codon:yes stop_codon:yes gene_type:complete
VAKKPTAKQVNDFSRTLINLQKTGDLEVGDLSKGSNMYETGLMSKQDVLEKLLGTKMSMSDAEYEMGTDLRGSKSIRDKAKAKGKKLPKKLKVGKKGGGKIYASMDKKYGGGIYPRKPTNG